MTTFNPDAVTVATACRWQAIDIASAWASSHPEYGTEALRTLVVSMDAVLNIGGQVYRDDDLSLFVRSHISMGMIFFRTHRDVATPLDTDIVMAHSAPMRGRYCMAPTADRYCGKPYKREHNVPGGHPTCECENPVPVAMPIPGTWSCHS